MLGLHKNYLCRVVLFSTAVLIACAAHAQDNSSLAVEPQAALRAQIAETQNTDWRNEIGTFKIGLVRGWSADMSRLALTRVETVFAKALGTPVKVVVFERFTSLLDAHAEGRIDLAAYSARAFAIVRLMCACVDALATPSTSEGQTGQLAILAGDNARIPSLAKLGSSKLGRIATTPITNHDVLRGTLVINDKPVTGKEEFWLDFPDYAAALQAYQTNQIDGFVMPVTASFGTVSKAGTVELSILSTQETEANSRPFAVLWRSSFWPYGPIAVRSNLAAEAKTIVLRTLEQMDVAEPLAHATLSEGLAGAFRKADGAGFAHVAASIKLLVGQNTNWR